MYRLYLSIWSMLIYFFALTTCAKDDHDALVVAYRPDGSYELEDMYAIRDNYTKEEKENIYFSHLLFFCPANTSSGHEINARSTTQNVLFFGRSTNKVDDFEHLLVCGSKYQPSVIQDPKTHPQLYSLGYEIWSDDQNLKNRFPLLESTKFDNLNPGFGWIPGLRVKYDKEKMRVIWVLYELNRGRHSFGVVDKCKNYQLGIKLFDNLEISDYYTKGFHYQQLNNNFKVPKPVPRYKKVDDVITDAVPISVVPPPSHLNSRKADTSSRQFRPPLPPLIIPPTKGDIPSTSRIYLDDKPNPGKRPRNEEPKRSNLLMKQLAPIDHFDIKSVKLLTCTYLNVAPMWSIIAGGVWSKVENLIQRVADVSGVDNLMVISGTYETQKFPSPTEPGKFQEIYLDMPNQRIPIPRIFWKLVSYKVSPEKDDSKSFIYRMLVVTHNETTDPVNVICQDICAANAWHDVMNPDISTGLTYCCDPLKNDLMTRLSVGAIPAGDILNLKAVVTDISSDGVVKKTLNVDKIINSSTRTAPTPETEKNESQPENDSNVESWIAQESDQAAKKIRIV